MSVGADLTRLAGLYGVAVEYDDYSGESTRVSAVTVREVLAAMDVATSTESDVMAAIEGAEMKLWRRYVAPSVVVRATGPVVLPIRVPTGDTARVTLRLEHGGTQDAAPTAREGAPSKVVDGRVVAEADVRLGELPLGYHELTVTAGGHTDTCVLIVAPERIPWPSAPGRVDGWMLQLYAARSRRSWGIGDLSDLASLATWSGRVAGMGAVLVNPLHAVAPVPPMQRSPYFPSSKRFVNPIYLDPEAVPAAASLDAPDQAELQRLAALARGSGVDLIDRDAVWAAKKPALELLFRQPRTSEQAYADYRARVSGALEDFATFCALAETYGGQWQQWPADLHEPRSAGVQRAAAERAERVEFYRWLQFQCDQQLRAAQQAARDAGMPIGVIHDLAIGVDPGGADAWAMSEDLAVGVTVGAPPDLYAKQGQDWSQPPLRPDRLRETGYAALRDMLRSALRNAGGIRIDHVLGLFRLWWIPPGRSAAEGTYVHYPADEMLGVLALEALRAGAIVVGEDLGTVPPGVREALQHNGILGSSVLYFERDWDGPVPPERWSPMSLATINTHDLPTAVGYLTNSRAPLYRRLGLLDDEQAAAESRRDGLERDQLVQLMVDQGFVGAGASIEELVAGLHVLLARSPCTLVLAALGDAVCDPRQPNVPGTRDDQHPNWCMPIATSVGGEAVPVFLEDLIDHPGVRRVVQALRGGRNDPPG